MTQEYDLQRATVGTTGQMREDIQGLSDEAKRLQATQRAAMEANTANNLKAATGGGGQMRPALVEQAAEAILDKYRDPQQKRKMKMKELIERIQEMEKQAKVAHDTTGNVTASNTYTQVANILKSRLHALQSEDVGAQPASADPERIEPISQTDRQPLPYATTLPAGGQ